MNPERQQAISYLQAPASALWRWSEEGRVIIWQDGSTVAFQEEILEILQWLAPNGLPPFGTLVLMLAACKGKLPDVNSLLGGPPPADSLPVEYARRTILQATRQQAIAQLQSDLADLKKISALPAELIKPLKAKCVLAEVIFEPAKVERQVNPNAVLAGLREPITDTELNRPSAQAPNDVRHVHILRNGLRDHSAETLLVRLRTGLDALPDDAEVRIPTFERARRLIENLREDPEHFGLALAARELMAAVRMPRRLAENEELAIAGVADITNRGPLDRLLLSELAHDDLTLAVRIALNESLYLRREPPRQQRPATLALLLDSGVRLWGIPRLLETAVALALVAREKQFGKVLAWRASGKTLAPVNLLERENLIAHLGTLEPQSHCGGALPSFSKALSDLGERQSVLVTHPDVLADPAFRRCLAEYPDSVNFIATVDRTGRFEMYKFPALQRDPICAANLDLESIFASKPNHVPLLNWQHHPGLPVILSMRPFPFLLPVAGRADYWTRSPEGKVFIVLNDRRLVEFKDERIGCQVIDSNLPAGKTCWMEADRDWIYLLKSASAQRPARLIILPHFGIAHPRFDLSRRVIDLPVGTDLRAVHRQGQILITIQPRAITAFSLDDGSRLGGIPCALVWLHGRYFKGELDFHFVSWNGAGLSLQPVTKQGNLPVTETLILFDREKEEGPWALQANGTVLSTASETKIRLPQPTSEMPHLRERIHVSRDGHRLFLENSHQKPSTVVDLRTRAIQGRFSNGDPDDILDPPPILPTWNVLRVVNSIAALPGEGLAICGRKDQWRKIILNQHGKIQIASCPRIYSGVLPFSAHPVPAELGCSLQVARWPDGSTAWLDSRGLLHLKSRDTSVPEISLVLSDGEVAGWTSNRLMCGPRFFLGKASAMSASDPVQVFEGLKKFVNLL